MGGSRCWGGAGFFHRVSAILHHILSNKTSSSMDIGLGSCCCHIDHVSIRANHSRSYRSWIYGTRRFDGASNAAARNGSCGMADSQRIQSIRNCFQISSGGIVEQPWKPKPQVEASDRRHTSSTRNCSN